MRRLLSRRLPAALPGLMGVVLALLGTPRAEGASAVLTKNGTLHEVFEAPYGQIITGANSFDAGLPVLALRTTVPGGQPTVEVVGGTVDELIKFGEALEFDETTQTVFVVYTKLQGFFLDVHVAMRRSGAWNEGRFLPNPGLYVSMNPQLLVTRQTYTGLDAQGSPVTKSRSILSIVWWEESNGSQARYAAVFIEDGSLRLDDVTTWNLNELNGASGPTDNTSLPISSYVHPAVQRDPVTNGGVLLSFANLATRTQQVMRLSFSTDDPTSTSGPPAGNGRTASSRHNPIGRSFAEFPLPVEIQLPSYQDAVGTLISPSGIPTFYWTSGNGLSYLQGGSTTTLT
ncbi:MAG: hypothetical protein ACXVID_03010, partial [Thermoanaerobaculia bacterium]